MAISPKAIYRFKSIDLPIKIPKQFFKYIKFIWKGLKPRIAKTGLNNKRRVRVITVPHLKLYCRAIVGGKKPKKQKTACAWYW
jgi:hypothetical protein